MSICNTWLEHAHKTPSQTALVVLSDTGKTAFNFQTLASIVGGVALTLGKRGFTSGSRLAVIGPNALAWVVLREACRWLGGVFIPLGFKLSVKERDWLLSDAQAEFIFGPNTLTKGTIAVESWDWVYQTVATDLFAIEKAPQATRLLYTSGSSGYPKGVVRYYQQDEIRAEQMMKQFRLDPADRHLIAGPLYHSGPAVFFHTYGLLGAPLYLLEKFDPDVVLELLTNGTIDSVFMVPNMWQMVLNAHKEQLPEKQKKSQLKRAFCAGSSLNQQTRQELLTWLGEGVFWEFYGATEIGTVTVLPPEKQHSHGHSVGFAGDDVKLLLLSANKQPVTIGQPGRIYVAGPQVAKAYHQGPRQPEKLDFLRLGDYVSLGDWGILEPDGALQLLGREGGMIISGGINIYPEEIENTLRTLPGVAEVVAFGQTDPRWGQVVSVIVEPLANAKLTVEMLRQQAQMVLANYKVPKHWAIATIERTPSYKVIRDPHKLAEILAQYKADLEK